MQISQNSSASLKRTKSQHHLEYEPNTNVGYPRSKLSRILVILFYQHLFVSSKARVQLLPFLFDFLILLFRGGANLRGSRQRLLPDLSSFLFLGTDPPSHTWLQSHCRKT